jgi:hypothetical protein
MASLWAHDFLKLWLRGQEYNWQRYILYMRADHAKASSAGAEWRQQAGLDDYAKTSESLTSATKRLVDAANVIGLKLVVQSEADPHLPSPSFPAEAPSVSSASKSPLPFDATNPDLVLAAQKNSS